MVQVEGSELLAAGDAVTILEQIEGALGVFGHGRDQGGGPGV